MFDHSFWDESFCIYGEPASAKNQRRVVKFGNKTAMIKSKKALNYSKAFEEQCPVLDKLITDDVAVRFDIWYASRRPDLSDELISDLLQKRIYANDRQVKARMAIWNLDRDCPRVRISIKRLPATGLENYSEKYDVREIFGE